VLIDEFPCSDGDWEVFGKAYEEQTAETITETETDGVAHSPTGTVSETC
jgi:hypothetical protein